MPYKTSDTKFKTLHFYDDYGQKIKEAAPTGITDFSYLGKTVQTSLSSGQAYSKTFDSQGNILASSDDAGSVNYTYKSVGKPGTITSNGAVWSMTYDNRGRQTVLNDPDAGTTSYTYNDFNELIKQVDSRGNSDSLCFDALGRVVKKYAAEGIKIYSYDPAGKPGVLSSITYPGGSETYNYDSYARLTGKVTSIDGTDYTTSYGYDTYVRPETTTYPSGFAVKNVFNTYGYLSEVRRSDNNSLIWKGVSANSFGQLTQYQYGNNLTTSRSYDNYGFLTNIQTGSVQNMDFSFNLTTGNLTGRTDNLRSLTETFSYDDLNRLTGVSGPAPLTMTYADNGNINTKTSTGTYSYDGSKPHAVTGVTNPEGLISAVTQRITYNSFNKADSIIQDNLTYTLAYGASDQRTVSKLFDGGTLQKTVHYVDGYEKEIKPGNNVRQLHYINGGNGLAAVFVRNNGLDTMYYVHTDHLGSVNVITNQSGTVVKNYSFDAWGRSRNPANWTYNNVPSTFLFSRGYTGHEHLDQFGLINMNGRIYDPLLCRFLSPDNYVQSPDFTQSFNRYSYCLNNPLKYIDPTGYRTWFGHFFDWVGESIVAKVVITVAINTVGIGALFISGGTVGGFGYYNGKSDWMINFGIMGDGFKKFGINMGGNKEGFYLYGETVVPFNSPPEPVRQTNINYGDSGSGISEQDLQELRSTEKEENYNSVEYTGFYYDNAEEMRNQLHHMSDMHGGVELILAEDYVGGAYLLPSKVYNGKEWLNNSPDNGYVSSYHLNILNIDKADIKMFGHNHDKSYRFTNPYDYNLYYNWRKSIYIIMPDGRILYKHYPTGVEYNYIPGY